MHYWFEDVFKRIGDHQEGFLEVDHLLGVTRRMDINIILVNIDISEYLYPDINETFIVITHK